MTAHVVYTAIDPERPATTSPVVLGEIVRGDIGFDGLLFSDDLSMKALGGPFEARTRAAFAAGVDIALHCNGDLAEARPVAEAAPPLAGPRAGAREVSVGGSRPPLRTSTWRPRGRASPRCSRRPEPVSIKYSNINILRKYLAIVRRCVSIPPDNTAGAAKRSLVENFLTAGRRRAALQKRAPKPLKLHAR